MKTATKRKPKAPKTVAKRTPKVLKTAPATKPQAALQVLPPSEKPWMLSADEVTLIKNNVAKGASDEELKFMLTVARRYKLDPFRKQIWFVPRWDKEADNGKGGKGAKVWVAQVGIDGLLFAAGRDHKAEFGSISLPEFGPTVNGHPQWARVKVWKKGAAQPTEAEAWWDEYAPADLSKAPFWRKMGRRMIAKCATALAIRQSYPDLGGLYIPEETERMHEDVTPSGRQIVETCIQHEILPAGPAPTEADLQRFESITATPWKEGRIALAGESGLAILRSEFSAEAVEELGLKRDAREKVTHLPVANIFKLVDRAKLCNVEVHYVEPNSPPGGVGEGSGEAAPQREAPPPEQGSLL